MSAIHVLAADGSYSAYDENTVRDMLQKGLISPQTLYWREGMPEWRPLHELSGATPAPATPPFPPSFASYTFTKDPASLTTWLKTLLYIYLAGAAINLLHDIVTLVVISVDNYTSAMEDTLDIVGGLIALVVLVVYITTAVFFLKWVYRANLNCRGFGALNMQFTPGWCIGWHFVPFLNLVRPYQAMKEIWQASTDPKDWPLQPVSAMLGWWWGLWLIGNFLGQISLRLTLHADDLAGKTAAAWVTFSSDLIDIPLTFVILAVISTIYQKQQALVRGSI